ncbi:membrane-anchored ubiquitin-fold protein 4 isoform X1 [Coffea arabica]|uniref:Membrane-anchored ubiquitin-fold protein 4 isoform X1 n=1 Tax=Coffea arabica TaxID=13443 RepID=A0A6P6VFZ8_COFAR|nr:membrane-anchored ubiquitin-fold protein 4 isoform X1 [Coffea arabica]XP_027101890.1 membrane-anchored ubiquitin-fold protein 4 isoform X1 [Coffea arabica]
MPEEDLVELKFRLYDGSDIGPFRYSPASTVAMLKERIVAEWPKDKKIAPKAANDVKLISAGKILENNRTVGQCKMPFGELPKGVITMHAVVQPSLAKAKTVGMVGMIGLQPLKVMMFLYLLHHPSGSMEMLFVIKNIQGLSQSFINLKSTAQMELPLYLYKTTCIFA